VVLVLVGINIAIVAVLPSPSERLGVPYSLFRGQVEAGNVVEVTSRGDTIQGTFRTPVTYPAKEGRTGSEFQTERPAFADDGLLELMLSKGVVVNARAPEEPRPLWVTVLLSLVPAILIVGVLVLLLRRTAGAGGMMGFGKSRAQRYLPTHQRVSFSDVAGIDEAKEELLEIVDFLKDPARYQRLGGMIPRGVLLFGPPGTGKTLLARAVAGEANVPFFSLSASEFVEMFVGVGASRVRDLFTRAKEEAPAIVFIDELDAIGRVRGAGPGFGGSDEREQTLNQILTEMDGFTGTEGVIVLAATNRPEILDPALLRPGRFDRRVSLNPPDQAGREAILRVHTRHMPLADDVDLSQVAATTPGMVGADLRNLANEAALGAARRQGDRVRLSDFTEALEKVLLGAERHIVISREERERTAYHESGHALLGMLQPGADPVRKVSIVPRGQSLGVTLQSPATDRYGYSSSYLRGRIIGALGGRAAEEIVYGDVTSGAENDLEQVTFIARQMVGRWGMSDAVGPVSVIPAGQVPPGAFQPPPGTSEETQRLLDAEVRRIVEQAHEAALALLRENRERLDALAHALLERETLDEADAYRIAGVPLRRDPDAPAPPPVPAVFPGS
jgi:cell division protease FtsH